MPVKMTQIAFFIWFKQTRCNVLSYTTKLKQINLFSTHCLSIHNSVSQLKDCKKTKNTVMQWCNMLEFNKISKKIAFLWTGSVLLKIKKQMEVFQQMSIDLWIDRSSIYFHITDIPLLQLVSLLDCCFGGKYGPESSLHCVKGYGAVGGRLR